MYIGQPVVATLELEGQLGVIDAHQVENRGLQVMHRNWIVGDAIANLIRLSQPSASLDTASAEPHGESAVVVAPDVGIVGFAL